MSEKFTTVTSGIYKYIVRHRSDARDPVLDALRKETEALGDISRMLISREQGSFFTIMIAALGVKSAIEVGTFTGYSSICIARGLPANGRLICCDISKEWTSLAQKYWTRAGVAQKIDLRLGPALETLQKLGPDAEFDFAFIDADKTEYDACFELLLPKMKPGTLIIFDNMLWGGRLGDGSVHHADGRAIHELNQKLSGDPRVETVLLPIADGLMVCRKR